MLYSDLTFPENEYQKIIKYIQMKPYDYTYVELKKFKYVRSDLRIEVTDRIPMTNQDIQNTYAEQGNQYAICVSIYNMNSETIPRKMFEMLLREGLIEYWKYSERVSFRYGG